MKPEISIVLWTSDHTVDVPEVLRRLGRQTVDANRYEVLLVDADHTINYDDAFAAVKHGELSNVQFHYHRADNGGRAKACNLGVAHSPGDKTK